MKPHFLAIPFETLADELRKIDQPAYRAKQLAEWVYGKAVTDPAAMTNLPRELTEQFRFLTSRVVARADSEDGTVKLLLSLRDRERIECVLMPATKRATACVSTQVGCAMGCLFCASGMKGFQRDLSAEEILEQVLHLQQTNEQRISNVVFMGMGEPLANYDATVSAIHALIDPDRFGLSARHITVSTIGLPREIRALAKEDLPITLAISLHAPNDALRQQLMPAAKASIHDILDAARTFYLARKREVTLEYVLMDGVNDTGVCADALAKLARQLRCNINLIRFNPVEGLSYRPSTPAAVQAFEAKLRKRGVNAKIRQPRGGDVAAACGQLRRSQAD